MLALMVSGAVVDGGVVESVDRRPPSRLGRRRLAVEGGQGFRGSGTLGTCLGCWGPGAWRQGRGTKGAVGREP